VNDLTELRSIAAAQHGLVSRAQCRDLGIDRHRLRRLEQAGHLSFLTPRVLRIGGSARSPWQSAMAGVLDVGQDALASHRTAASMWGVPGLRLEPVHVAVTRVLTRREPVAATIHRLTVIPRQQRTALYDIPVIAPPMTVLLVCGSDGPHVAARVLDHFLADRIVTVAETWDLVERMSQRGRNGLVDVRRLLRDRSDDDMPPQSNNERRFEAIALESGITTLVRQTEIRVGSWVGRVDYRDRELPLVYEIQSERFHTTTTHRRNDAARIAQLERAGYTVVVVWDYEIWNDPAGVADRIVAARSRLLRAVSGFS
jgi:very-short-patch-repair endonuclease